MKKIALVSAYNYNYGSVLQAYALQHILQQNGINTEVLRYTKKNDLRQMVRIFNYPLLKAKVKVIAKQQYFKREPMRLAAGRIRNKKFEVFLKRLKFSEEINGYQNLKESIKNYNGVILGSDQVWNPMNLGTDFYNLLFVPEEIKKCTYASSFGVSKIPFFQQRKTKRYLSRINMISVREKKGKEIVLRLLKRTVRVDVDPTLLFDQFDWAKMIPDQSLIKEKYIFAYFVGENKNYREYVEKISKEKQYRLIIVPHVDEIVDVEKKYETEFNLSIGPEEFVNLIRNAEIIFTDSFHATVFSILYNKRFFVFDRFVNQSKQSMNSRIENLLQMTRLEGRKVSEYEEIESRLDSQLDFNDANSRLQQKRNESIEYIKTLKQFLEC